MKVFISIISLTILLSVVSGQSTWVDDLSGILTRQGLPENLPIGSVIGTLNHVVTGQRNPTYSTTSPVFSVDGDTGLVTLREELNYKISPTFTVDFYAKIPTENYENIARVTVKVLPINHQPLFSAPNYTTSISEDARVGSRVFDQIYVTDRDTGNNGTVSIACLTTTSEWSLACQSFSLSIQQLPDERNQVTVTVAKALDYSVKNTFTLQMRASDGGSPALSSESTLTIIVENARDTRPVFLSTPIIIVVPEMANTSTDLPDIQARRRTNSNNDVRIKIVSDPLKYFNLGPTTSQGDVYSAKIRTNGNINLQDVADLSNQYVFTVAAVELFNGQETQVSSETTVTVQITDVNNNRPAFEQTSYTANVTEGMPIGAFVPGLTLVVEDLDTGDNAFLVLEAASSRSPADIFGVYPTSGEGKVSFSLIVLRPDQLIYDDPNKRQYTVTVTARENKTSEKYSGQATVTIYVLNPNNQPTPFPQSVYTTAIVDNRQIGDLVQSVAITDPGTASSIRYAITAGNEAQLFQINPSSGLISIARPLNATANPLVTLTVSATNRYGLVSYTSVRITIRDSRSQGPVFQQEPYVTTVDENSVDLIPRIRVWATPLKSDKVVRYAIVAGNEDNLFQLNATTPPAQGVDLIMKKGVDYNDTPNRQGYYLLVIEAADDVVQPLFTNTTVVINIRDSNNHAPTFLQNATYYGSVNEISPPDFSVVQVNATDLDAGENSRLSYILGFGSKDNFAIDYTTGLLTVAPLSDLNIERYGDQYNITIYAIDHGSPQLTGTATIYVKVNDSIYQTPVFSQSEYLFTIIESSPVDTSVGTVSARALDIGARLMYLLDTSSITARDDNGQPVNVTNSTYNFREAFKIDPTTGTISVAQRLSRQYAASIEFNALANVTNPDRPTPAAKVKVTVYILPAGTGTQPTITFYRPPMINNELNVSIFETPVAGGQITQFGAVYVVGSTQTQVTDYRLGQTNDQNNLVSINSTTGALTVAKPINYDALPNKVLTYEIIARAPAPSNLSATATIHITVRSLAEGRPVFSNTYYNFSIREDAQMNTIVGTVKATLKIQGEIGYKLTGSPNDFNINFDTGDISVKNPLDAETRPRYVLTAMAEDKSGMGQIQSVSALVYIYVLDVNEHGPQFLGEPYNVVVYDTAGPGTTLIQVQAIDTDASQTKVTYEITGGNDKGLFKIDPNTGLITPTRNLTNESRTTPYEIEVTARDSGSPSLSSTTTVNILIRNQTSQEGPPLWVRPKDGDFFKVYENRVNETVVDANAVSGRLNFPNITYVLHDSPANRETNSRFSFDATTGLLVTAVPLNRTERFSYELVLQALDSGSPALSSLITINVTVYSDAPPSFTSCPGTFNYPEITASVLEKQPPGQHVTTVKACVFDKENTPIYYYITAGNESYLGNTDIGPPFIINKDSGLITTNTELRWYDSPILYINVTASKDRFGPDSALNIPGATIRVKVLINGTDASGPSFEPRPDMKEFCRGIGTQVTTGILDITEYGVQVIQFYAGDCDSPENRNHTFSITSPNFFPPNKPQNGQSSPKSFYIDSYTGWVYTGETSYRKFTDGIFRMTVRVVDLKGRSATSELTVYIIRESQRLRYTFGKGPRDVEGTVPNFVGDINTELDKIQTNPAEENPLMVSDVLRVHVDPEANPILDKSDLCFHVREGDKVLNVDQVKELYGNIPKNATDSIYARYGVDTKYEDDQPLPCNYHVTTKKWSGKWFLWWLLIALALFIILITLILILCVCIYWPISRRNYFKSRPYVVLDDPPAGTTSEFEWQHSIHRVD